MNTKQRLPRYCDPTDPAFRTRRCLTSLAIAVTIAVTLTSTVSAQEQQQHAGYIPEPYPQPYQQPAVVEMAPEPAPDAVEEEDESAPFFDLMVGTQVPLSMGGMASLELPGRLLIQGHLGWMPGAYGSAINGVVSSVGAYDSQTAALIDASLNDAMVVQLGGGWRPFPSAGFEIFGGYTHIALSGSVSPSAVANVVGGDFAAQVASQTITDDVTISSSLHNFHVGLGWRWVAFDRLVIRASIAYTQTLGSSTSIESPDQPEAAALANPYIDDALGSVYKDYVKLPLIGLGLGYRF
jgi:hypothetical protein